jgi:YjbE family integral membrane protein
MSGMFEPEIVTAFLQVLMVDLVLAGDNAIVIGLAAAGLPDEQRNSAIGIGILAATGLRILFASITVTLLRIVGLVLAGGVLLLWVCWKMWRELTVSKAVKDAAEEAIEHTDLNADGTIAAGVPRKTFAQAATQIVVADVSMSLDNVLAVAGAAREHPMVLVFGLVLSIGLMGLAATLVAKLLHRHRWIAFVGLAIIFYIALKMIYDGWVEVEPILIGLIST